MPQLSRLGLGNLLPQYDEFALAYTHTPPLHHELFLFFRTVGRVQLTRRMRHTHLIRNRTLNTKSNFLRAIRTTRRNRRTSLLTHLIRFRRRIQINQRRRNIPNTQISNRNQRIASIRFITNRFLLITTRHLTTITFPNRRHKQTFFTRWRLLVTQVPNSHLRHFILVLEHTRIMFKRIITLRFTNINVSLSSQRRIFTLVNSNSRAVNRCNRTFQITPTRRQCFTRRITLRVRFGRGQVFTRSNGRNFNLQIMDRIKHLILFRTQRHFTVSRYLVVQRPSTFLTLNQTLRALRRPRRTAIIPVRHGHRTMAHGSRRRRPMVPTRRGT